MLRGARRRAGLTQRSLAAIAGIPQETIARIERSTVQPRFDTLALLLDACGFELEVMPRIGVGVDATLIDWMLSLGPDARLDHGFGAARGIDELGAAWKRARAADGD